MIGDAFRKLIAVVILLAAIGGIYKYYEATRPCARPIVYTIGAQDSRFGVSSEALRDDLAKAAKLWNDAAGRELLQYSSTKGIPVSLVYDSRQQTTEVGEELAAAQATYEAHKRRVEAERAAFEQHKTPEGATALNADIAALNAEARALNVRVASYNQTAGELFEAGLYHSDRSGAAIELYEFANTTELIRIAAHEFGHAIGLNHNDDPISIMYPQNKSASLKLSSADTAALNDLCGFE